MNPSPTEFTLSVATQFAQVEGRNVAAHRESVRVVVDPDLAVLGESQAEAYGYTVTVRRLDAPVLLHELLHVILGRFCATEADPHSHQVINRIEVGLTPHLPLLAALTGEVTR